MRQQDAGLTLEINNHALNFPLPLSLFQHFLSLSRSLSLSICLSPSLLSKRSILNERQSLNTNRLHLSTVLICCGHCLFVLLLLLLLLMSGSGLRSRALRRIERLTSSSLVRWCQMWTCAHGGQPHAERKFKRNKICISSLHNSLIPPPPLLFILYPLSSSSSSSFFLFAFRTHPLPALSPPERRDWRWKNAERPLHVVHSKTHQNWPSISPLNTASGSQLLLYNQPRRVGVCLDGFFDVRNRSIFRLSDRHVCGCGVGGH